MGGCDSGYSCAYSNTLAWSSPTTPLPYETNPRAVFERLFGDGETTDTEARAMRSRENRSLLDFVLADASRLSTNLGATDRRKMSDYLDSVREVERRIQKAEEQNAAAAPVPALDRPDGIPPTFEEHIQLMYDLMTIAFQADLTRVITMMYSREGGNRTYRSIGVPDAHHGLSHHMNDPAKMARLQLIDHHHVDMFSHFLGKMQAAKDGDGSLLDHSMIVYGSSLSDSNRHLHDNLPVLLVGGGNGKLQPGRHIRYPEAHADDQPVPDHARHGGRARGKDRRFDGQGPAPQRSLGANRSGRITSPALLADRMGPDERCRSRHTA